MRERKRGEKEKERNQINDEIITQLRSPTIGLFLFQNNKEEGGGEKEKRESCNAARLPCPCSGALPFAQSSDYCGN